MKLASGSTVRNMVAALPTGTSVSLKELLMLPEYIHVMAAALDSATMPRVRQADIANRHPNAVRVLIVGILNELRSFKRAPGISPTGRRSVWPMAAIIQAEVQVRVTNGLQTASRVCCWNT